VPPVSVHPLMLSSVRPRKAERLLLKALNAGGACLAWGRPGPHPRALTRSSSEPHGPRQPAKSCRELRFVSSKLPPLEYLLLQTLRSDLAAAMQLGAGDGQLATLGGPGPSVKWCGTLGPSKWRASDQILYHKLRRCMHFSHVRLEPKYAKLATPQCNPLRTPAARAALTPPSVPLLVRSDRGEVGIWNIWSWAHS